MSSIRDRLAQNKRELAVYRHAPSFAPAGQSTQMIIGATPVSYTHLSSTAFGALRQNVSYVAQNIPTRILPL